MDLKISEMMEMQRQLQEVHRDDWGGLDPARGAFQLLWALGEMGELIDIIKKKGEADIMNDARTRAWFTEEFADVMMYMNDILLCFGISADEVSLAYAGKHDYNMRRVYSGVTHHEKEDGGSL